MKLTSKQMQDQQSYNMAEACARGLLEHPNLSSERWCNDLACAMFILYPSMELDYNCDCATEYELEIAELERQVEDLEEQLFERESK